jgi:hypothetical protein
MIVPRGMGGVVQDVAAAIKRQENVNPAYNNPGGLIAAPGCTSRPGQIAICPDAATGQADLERQVQLYADRGYNLSDMINAWAPASCPGSLCTGNNPSAYTANVSAWTGLPANVPLNQLGAGVSPSLDTSAVDTSGVDLSAAGAVDSSGWLWAGAIGAALLLAFAMER